MITEQNKSHDTIDLAVNKLKLSFSLYKELRDKFNNLGKKFLDKDKTLDYPEFIRLPKLFWFPYILGSGIFEGKVFSKDEMDNPSLLYKPNNIAGYNKIVGLLYFIYWMFHNSIVLFRNKQLIDISLGEIKKYLKKSDTNLGDNQIEKLSNEIAEKDIRKKYIKTINQYKGVESDTLDEEEQDKIDKILNLTEKFNKIVSFDKLKSIYNTFIPPGLDEDVDGFQRFMVTLGVKLNEARGRIEKGKKGKKQVKVFKYNVVVDPNITFREYFENIGFMTSEADKEEVNKIKSDKKEALLFLMDLVNNKKDEELYYICEEYNDYIDSGIIVLCRDVKLILNELKIPDHRYYAHIISYFDTFKLNDIGNLFFGKLVTNKSDIVKFVGENEDNVELFGSLYKLILKLKDYLLTQHDKYKEFLINQIQLYLPILMTRKDVVENNLFFKEFLRPQYKDIKGIGSYLNIEEALENNLFVNVGTVRRSFLQNASEWIKRLHMFKKEDLDNYEEILKELNENPHLKEIYDVLDLFYNKLYATVYHTAKIDNIRSDNGKNKKFLEWFENNKWRDIKLCSKELKRDYIDILKKILVENNYITKDKAIEIDKEIDKAQYILFIIKEIIRDIDEKKLVQRDNENKEEKRPTLNVYMLDDIAEFKKQQNNKTLASEYNFDRDLEIITYILEMSPEAWERYTQYFILSSCAYIPNTRLTINMLNSIFGKQATESWAKNQGHSGAITAVINERIQAEETTLHIPPPIDIEQIYLNFIEKYLVQYHEKLVDSNMLITQEMQDKYDSLSEDNNIKVSEDYKLNILSNLISNDISEYLKETNKLSDVENELKESFKNVIVEKFNKYMLNNLEKIKLKNVKLYSYYTDIVDYIISAIKIAPLYKETLEKINYENIINKFISSLTEYCLKNIDNIKISDVTLNSIYNDLFNKLKEKYKDKKIKDEEYINILVYIKNQLKKDNSYNFIRINPSYLNKFREIMNNLFYEKIIKPGVAAGIFENNNVNELVDIFQEQIMGKTLQKESYDIINEKSEEEEKKENKELFSYYWDDIYRYVERGGQINKEYSYNLNKFIKNIDNIILSNYDDKNKVKYENIEKYIINNIIYVINMFLYDNLDKSNLKQEFIKFISNFIFYNNLILKHIDEIISKLNKRKENYDILINLFDITKHIFKNLILNYIENIDIDDYIYNFKKIHEKNIITSIQEEINKRKYKYSEILNSLVKFIYDRYILIKQGNIEEDDKKKLYEYIKEVLSNIIEFDNKKRFLIELRNCFNIFDEETDQKYNMKEIFEYIIREIFENILKFYKKYDIKEEEKTNFEIYFDRLQEIDEKEREKIFNKFKNLTKKEKFNLIKEEFINVISNEIKETSVREYFRDDIHDLFEKINEMILEPIFDDAFLIKIKNNFMKYNRATRTYIEKHFMNYVYELYIVKEFLLKYFNIFKNKRHLYPEFKFDTFKGGEPSPYIIVEKYIDSIINYIDLECKRIKDMFKDISIDIGSSVDNYINEIIRKNNDIMQKEKILEKEETRNEEETRKE